MKASPIIPGRAYRVSYHGHAQTVLAKNPCAAIVIAVRSWV